MRLSEQEISHIIEALSFFIHDQKAEIYLYGSRTNDDLKGGDIDLLLLLDSSETMETLSSQKHEILAKVKSLIGDQRIDLKITCKEKIDEDPFLNLILPTSILLYQWS